MSARHVQTRVCSEPDCDRLHVARGWCAKHYSRWYERTTKRYKKRADYMAEYRLRNDERTKECARERTRLYRERQPDKWRIPRLRRYGLTIADYDRMVDEQKGVCAICHGHQPDGRRLYVDHCHTTGIVRGLLCVSCNRGLGSFIDNPEALRRAALYLERAEGVMLDD